jgi:GDP-D-mannose 3',5'-epimerase
VSTSSGVVVVTGAGGFIGGNLIAALRRRGVQRIRAVDCKPIDEWYQRFEDVENLSLDLNLKENCESVARDASDLYNLAANMGGMGFIEHNKALCMLSVLINTHMLQAALRHGVKRFFYASSACVYNGDKQKTFEAHALKEEDAYPALAEDGYGWEKLFSERMCRHFREDFGLCTRVARFHNVYGPCGTWYGGREKAPAAICRKVIEAKLSGKYEIEIWGAGTQTRSFMFIDDCLKGIDLIMNSEILEPINLGSSEAVTINQLVDRPVPSPRTRRERCGTRSGCPPVTWAWCRLYRVSDCLLRRDPEIRPSRQNNSRSTSSDRMCPIKTWPS